MPALKVNDATSIDVLEPKSQVFRQRKSVTFRQDVKTHSDKTPLTKSTIRVALDALTEEVWPSNIQKTDHVT